jgi:hypothetical protein
MLGQKKRVDIPECLLYPKTSSGIIQLLTLPHWCTDGSGLLPLPETLVLPASPLLFCGPPLQAPVEDPDEVERRTLAALAEERRLKAAQAAQARAAKEAAVSAHSLAGQCLHSPLYDMVKSCAAALRLGAAAEQQHLLMTSLLLHCCVEMVTVTLPAAAAEVIVAACHRRQPCLTATICIV